jgi:hypothetical protein
MNGVSFATRAMFFDTQLLLNFFNILMRIVVDFFALLALKFD